jgi:thiamine transport system substrate-binding protein
MPHPNVFPSASASGSFSRTGEEMPMPRMKLAAAALAAAVTATPVAAQEKPALTVYTYSGFPSEYGPGGVIKERFEAVCGCTLEWVTSDDAGTLLSRLKLEGAGTSADVVLGLDTNLITDAKASGLFAPHNVDAGKLDLPIEWTDDTFLPFDWGWFAFVYDKRKVENPPTSLKELVEAEDGVAIVIEDPRTSTPGLGLLVWMRNVFGDGAADAWKKLAPKIVTVTPGWTEAYGMFLKGEADMVLSYTTSPAYHLAVENDPNFDSAIFSEGHYLEIEVAGMTKSTDEPELARQFLAFMVSEPFQSAIPEGNWMYPARLTGSGLPASFQNLSKPEKSLYAEPAEVEANRRAWVDEWLAAMSR